VNPYFRLLRPGNALIGWVGTVIGGYATTGVSALAGPRFLLVLLLAGLTTFLVTAAGNVLNDYRDRDEDRINHPDRPMASGAVGPARGRGVLIALFAVSPLPLLVAGAISSGVPLPVGGLLPIGLWGLAVALLFSYEGVTKARGLPGNLTVAFLTGEVFLFGGAVVGHPVQALPLLGMATFATLSREIIKDMEDVGGDLSRRTLPKMRGMALSSAAARAAVGLALVLSPVPLLTFLAWGTPAFVIYLLFVAASDAVFVWSVLDLPRKLHEGQARSKLGMVLALAAFLGAALR
jgi:geranylgeranylglycerol-phosphate geranylgeranyltransferase